MYYGNGKFSYEWVEDWGIQAKQRWNVKEVAGVTVDRSDHVYLLTRVVPPVIELDREGTIVDFWGEQLFIRAHGMHQDSNGFLYGVDDGGHAVYQFNPQKKLTMTLGKREHPSDTGCVNKDYKTILRAAGPFYCPTRITSDQAGRLYVTDGYGNARVHQFAPDGSLLKSWGEPGDGPGQFRLPHGIALGKNGVLYVADRENHRVQLFDTDGNYLDQWNGLHRPSDIWIDSEGFIFVAECKRTSEFDESPSRVSIFDTNGCLLARLDKQTAYDPQIGSRCAHGIAVDSQGSLYITEVAKKAGESFFGVKKYRRV